ncbi:MAG: hypothetical protein II363_03415 [Clostridia bacterium]|nr:hypothetical protein [Clostridia bacterium]
MHIGETLALIITLFLALYGCAQLIRRICLWMVRCPDCADCWRLAIPRGGSSAAPLFRCLQAQAAWEESGGCSRTLVVLSEMSAEERCALENLLREAPAVTPVTVAELTTMIAERRLESQRKES